MVKSSGFVAFLCLGGGRCWSWVQMFLMHPFLSAHQTENANIQLNKKKRVVRDLKGFIYSGALKLKLQKLICQVSVSLNIIPVSSGFHYDSL